jgi:hypothetical protein
MVKVGEGWWKSVEVGGGHPLRCLIACLVQTPGEKTGAILLIVQGLPVGCGEQPGFMDEA